ncbi:amidase [Candidatus Palauibacter soopunensis]|uniref:amidase n=1 Tax=Candidatus Palauibacter soopunensis TaxID=3056739 RepID=UPI002393EE08|nr:amidase [Candidatus Palauibacter soopunensis]MDE2877333.1 amidase [Candidatus Palauibacter soopunensis]
MATDSGRPALDRRAFMASLSALGLGGTALPAALWARTNQGQEAVTRADISAAVRVAGLDFSEDEVELMVEEVNAMRERYAQLRTMGMPNSVVPALHFDPVLPGTSYPAPSASTVFRYTRPRGLERPANLEELAFRPVTDLAQLVRARQVTSTELTEMYLGRLRAHGDTLLAVIALTEDLAMRQAARADAEIARGYYRGPLHGIPWGAKDLLSEDETLTTWGAKPYEDQYIPEDSTVGRKLEEAGAVLVAKLTLGALARGDVWYGGLTRNPWNLEQGSSGSSAGSTAAVVAGLVGFAIGSETLGSIVSPSTRCGASGLRPTFGRVSRAGAMALSWSMDKLGPICRSVEDCAIVLDAIQGSDDQDPTARDVAFDWDPERPLSDLRVAYVPSAFEEEREDVEWKAFDETSLEVVRGLGIDPVPVELPDDLPYDAMRIILSAEQGAAFDDLILSGREDDLVLQGENARPNIMRTGRMIPASEYIQANRLRTIAMHRFARAMEGIDVVVTPSFGGSMLLLTNLTGHPQVVIPNGYRSEDGTPTSISFVGKLFGDAEALRLAKAVQDATEHHLQRPPQFAS